jgi:hypothetical protein
MFRFSFCTFLKDDRGSDPQSGSRCRLAAMPYMISDPVGWLLLLFDRSKKFSMGLIFPGNEA